MAVEAYGNYQLIKKLATGGMAQIYLARQAGPEGFEKLLVVKRILPHLAENDDFIKMFLDEARIAARLNHPNVVQIFNLGAQDESFFIAMEYIHGEDVRRVWKRTESMGKIIPVPLVCRIIMEACSGLDYAHKKTDQGGRPLNIVHRDISPQNILVTFEGGVKVVDFGIAKAADQATVTKSGVLKGKYSYMSPEQASGKRIDARTDIFALGVVLYELLTMTRLFKRSNDIQTLNAVTECEVAPPSSIDDRLPKSLDAIVLKALAKSPDDRYLEAAHLQAALEDWLLQHQLPSGSTHLAAFMQELYAERLQREAEEGRLIVETLDGQKPLDDELSPRKATPKPKTGNSLRAQTSGERRGPASGSARVAAPPEQATSAERLAKGSQAGATSKPRTLEKVPEVVVKPTESSLEPIEATSSQRAITEVSGRRSTAKKGRAGPIVGALLLLGAAGGAALFAQQWRAGPEVTVRSEPPGARVKVGEVALAGKVTPLRLAEAKAGPLTLTLSLPGYRDRVETVELPAQGVVELGPYPLEKLPGDAAAAANGQQPAASGQPAAAPAVVRLTLRTQPSGAQVSVNGQKLGPSPATLELPAQSEARVVASQTGYRDAEQTFPVGAGGAQEHTLALEREKRPGPTARPPPAVQEPKPSAKGVGTARFAVTPWATVTCNGRNLGETPFTDQKLVAGEYRCTFSNPDFAEKTQVVVVNANEVTIVKVSF